MFRDLKEISSEYHAIDGYPAGISSCLLWVAVNWATWDQFPAGEGTYLTALQTEWPRANQASYPKCNWEFSTWVKQLGHKSE
jgi:hypothetical protein